MTEDPAGREPEDWVVDAMTSAFLGGDYPEFVMSDQVRASGILQAMYDMGVRFVQAEDPAGPDPAEDADRDRTRRDVVAQVLWNQDPDHDSHWDHATDKDKAPYRRKADAVLAALAGSPSPKDDAGGPS